MLESYKNFFLIAHISIPQICHPLHILIHPVNQFLHSSSLARQFMKTISDTSRIIKKTVPTFGESCKHKYYLIILLIIISTIITITILLMLIIRNSVHTVL